MPHSGKKKCKSAGLQNKTREGVGGVLVRRKCVKAAPKKKQRDLLLKKLVAKTDEIERGLNDGDGESARE